MSGQVHSTFLFPCSASPCGREEEEKGKSCLCHLCGDISILSVSHSTAAEAELPFYKSKWSLKWWSGTDKCLSMKIKCFAMMRVISQCNNTGSYGFFVLRYTFTPLPLFFVCIHLRFGPVAQFCVCKIDCFLFLSIYISVSVDFFFSPDIMTWSFWLLSTTFQDFVVLTS